MKNGVRLCAAVLALVPCLGASAPKTDDPAAQIASAYQAFVEAQARLDAAAIAGLYDPRATILPPRVPPITGRGAIKTYWATSLAKRHMQSEQFTPLSLVVTGDYAIDVEAYAGVTKELKSQITRAFAGKNLVVWHRQRSGEWQIFRDMWSSTALATVKRDP